MSDQEQICPQIPFFCEKSGDLKVRQAKLVNFLAEHGFGKIYAESEMSSFLVQIEDGIVLRTALWTGPRRSGFVTS